MKIVVLNGSPRKGGNTSIMADAFATAARKNQHEVTILNIAAIPKLEQEGYYVAVYC